MSLVCFRSALLCCPAIDGFLEVGAGLGGLSLLGSREIRSIVQF